MGRIPKTGSNVKLEPFEHLIQHIKQTDPMLYEALKRVSRYFTVIEEEAAPVSADIYWRVLLVKDSTVGTDISDAEVVQADGTGIRIAWVLHRSIASNLVVAIKKNAVLMSTVTVLSSSTLDTEYELAITSTKFKRGEILTFDITASDGTKNAAGIASITIIWA